MARFLIACVALNRFSAGEKKGTAKPELSQSAIAAIAGGDYTAVTAYMGSMDAAYQAMTDHCECEKQIGNALHFNMRNNNSEAAFYGNSMLLQTGPFTNTVPNKKFLPKKFPVYINIYQ